MTTKQREAVLPQVKKMLGRAAADRIAGGRRRRPSRSGFAIIAFAGLALAGSAMAATGVWNPLGGGEPRAQQPTQSGDAAEPQIRIGSVAPSPSGDPRHAVDRAPTGGRNDGGVVTPGGTGESIVDDSSGEAGTSQPEPVNGGDAVGAPVQGGSQPKGSGGPTGAGGPRGEPGDPKPEPPHTQNTQIVFDCGPEETGVGQTAHCGIKVTGEGGAPSGQVVFGTGGGGSFSAESCVLTDSGNGTTSSCTVDYTPTSSGTHQLSASYGGDPTHTSSSATFVLKAS